MSNNTDSRKDIYRNGFIYQGVDMIPPENHAPTFSAEAWDIIYKHKEKYDRYLQTLPHFEVLNPPASWKDGQPLELNKDYGLQCQWYSRVADRWDNCSDDQYESVAEEAARRIIALRLPNSVIGEAADNKRETSPLEFIEACENTMREVEGGVEREAKELVDRFFSTILHWDIEDGYILAKQLAIIHCDGVIEVLKELEQMIGQTVGSAHWTAIREAINNI